MTTYEYRVTVKREGCRVKYHRYATERGARRYLTLLGPEPWKAWGEDPSAEFCCSGYGCSCEGLTVQQCTEVRRAQMPAIEFIRLERRETSPWEEVQEQEAAK